MTDAGGGQRPWTNGRRTDRRATRPAIRTETRKRCVGPPKHSDPPRTPSIDRPRVADQAQRLSHCRIIVSFKHVKIVEKTGFAAALPGDDAAGGTAGGKSETTETRVGGFEKRAGIRVFKSKGYK